MKHPPFTLRVKFIFGLVLFALLLGISLAVIMYFHFNSIMQSEISQRSHLLLAQSEAVQTYVRKQLRPAMFETLPEGQFVLKAMSSSYISRQIMASINTGSLSEYYYRRVSTSPRNPAYKATDYEAGLIKRFAENPDLTFWEEDTMVGDRHFHLVAKPVHFGPSCMQCHGDPKDAPRELTDIYGDKSGFNWSPGQVGGVVLAGFPVDMIKVPVLDVTSQYISLYFIGILLFGGLISLLFDRLVMKNLHALTGIFKSRFSGEQEQGIIERLGQKGEMEGLIKGVEELAIHLSDARNELEDHAQHLENRVAERTRKLHIEAGRHLSDVRLFVDLLSRFSESQSVEELITDVLAGVAERYGADQVIYYCTVLSQNIYPWKPQTNIEMVEKNIKNLLWKNEVRASGDSLFIPVKSLESHWGILRIQWENNNFPEDVDTAVLLALGHQMGVLIENIQAVANIRYQHDMLQSIFEGISDPLLLIDMDGRILVANNGSRCIFPASDDRPRQEQLTDFLSQGTYSARSGTILNKVKKTLTPVSDEIQTPDNRYFAVEVYPLPDKEKKQTMIRMVVYAREVTLEKQMLERMQQAERLSAIGKMAAGIAHEINNPLGVIQCYIDLVRDGIGGDVAQVGQIQKDIGVIEKQTRSVQTIVQNLLNLSRPKQIIESRCSIGRILENALSVFKAQAASKEIEIVCDPAVALPDVSCDAAVLEQVLTNLWLNAFDAVDEKNGSVHISTTLKEKKWVILRVEDNGPGISQENIPHIFDPFYTTKEVGKGTGLGLSVVYGLIREIGGKIDVMSDRTTVFNVFLPVAGKEGK